MPEPVPDSPVPFGYKTCWFAVRSPDSAAVASALQFRESSRATWAEGVEAAYAGAIFVSPPVDGWTLVVGEAVAPDVHDPNGGWRARVVELSKHFEDVQLFVSHRVAEMHGWARARRGVVERAYCYVGESGEVVYDEGEQTQAECELGFDFDDPNSAEEKDETYWEREGLFPTEESVMALAGKWSISPITLSPALPPGLGLLVTARASRQASAARRPWWRFW